MRKWRNAPTTLSTETRQAWQATIQDQRQGVDVTELLIRPDVGWIRLNLFAAANKSWRCSSIRNKLSRKSGHALMYDTVVHCGSFTRSLDRTAASLDSEYEQKWQRQSSKKAGADRKSRLPMQHPRLLPFGNILQTVSNKTDWFKFYTRVSHIHITHIHTYIYKYCLFL